MNRQILIAVPQNGICTSYLQDLIDRCSAADGGQVRLTAGIYHTGTLYLKSHTELYFDAGAVLAGSSNPADYSNRCPLCQNLPEIPQWYDSMISAIGQTDISICGEGIIDGVDCYNPVGEQDFRGPHTIYMADCSNISIRGISIVRSACYSTMFERCADITVEQAAIRGGQDAFRFANCSGVRISRCDIRSGDDCIGGGGNYDFTISDCWFNSPGDANILFNCVNLTIRRCRFWSQGAYPAVFRDDKRYSLGHSAIVPGFAYGYTWTDISDNWLIQDTVFENVQSVLRQERITQGRPSIPLRHITLERVKAINMVESIKFEGVEGYDSSLVIKDSSFHLATEDKACENRLLDAGFFDSIVLDGVRVHGCDEQVIACHDGNSITVNGLTIEKTADASAVSVSGVKECSVSAPAPETLSSRYVFGNTDSIYYPKDTEETFRGPIRYIPRNS